MPNTKNRNIELNKGMRNAMDRVKYNELTLLYAKQRTTIFTIV